MNHFSCGIIGWLALLFCSCASTPHAVPETSGKAVVPAQRFAHGPAEVIVVDGILGTPWDFLLLRKRLSREVAPTRVWRYDNSGLTSLEAAAAGLAAELKRARRPFSLVGFSMGGLVIREAMRQAPDLPLQRAVLMHTPNSGSLLAYLLPTPAGREMRPGSAFLRRLEAAPWPYPTLVTYSPADLMVIPGTSARWDKATRIIRSPMPAHAWPLVSPSLHRSVASFLAGN